MSQDAVDNVPAVLAVGFLFFGGLGIYVAVRALVRQFRLSSGGIRTQCVVVRHVTTHSSTGNGWTHYPVMAFRDEHGVPQQVTSPIGTSAQQPRVGARVAIRYLPGRPETAEFDTWWYPLVSVAAFGVMGFLFATVGVVMSIFVFG